MNVPTGPITAIGGLGGSGTRVVAAMLRQAGVFIGEDLNGPLDNLWFTVLFKRRDWTDKPPPASQIVTAIRLFRQAMTLGLAAGLSGPDQALIETLQRDLLPDGAWDSGAKIAQARNLLQSGASPVAMGGPWGWKEPNTHVFLPYLDQLLPDFRYIHIVRDGLDMAFSGNTWQAQNWGHILGLPPDPDVPLPVHQLRYWLAANRRALTYGQTRMQGRFMVIRYEDFCTDPMRYWHLIKALSGGKADSMPPPDLVRPTTIGRAGTNDLSVIPIDLRREVADFQLGLANLQD
ncbi:sulfotransferase family protein [Sulfitobacter porphyrae]|nr:sulfotransferase family protein [Sulfitobacter porphyrae]